MRSMRARLLAAFILLFIINSVLLLLSLFFGYDSSRKYWDEIVEEESRERIMGYILESVEETGGLDLENSEEVMNSSRTFLIGAAQIFLFNPEGVPVRSWTNPIMDRYSYINPDIKKALPLLIKGETMGFVQICPLSFSNVKHNNIFIARVLRLLLVGLVFSTGISILVAFRISARFTREARNTARSLINLAGGSRDEEFCASPTRELSSINKAAGTLQSMLIQEEARRNRWSVSIAHDLRTPITAVKTQFAALRDGALPHTPERYDRILSDLDTIETLARDFLALGDLDKAGENLQISSIKTETLKKDLEENLRPVVHAGEITISWDIRLDSFKCDYALTLKALESLIKNALQHTVGQGNVKIAVKGSPLRPRITITNPGRIPEEDLPHIFDPLYKTDKSRKKEGNGLGLTIARKIALFHNGSLTVENLRDDLVSFNFRLNLS